MISVIGVDPGKNGAWAMVKDGDLCEVRKFKKKIEPCRTIPFDLADFVCIEKVHSSPQQGVVSAFTFGKYAEAVETAAFLAKPDYLMVRPNDWQATLGCQTKGNKTISFNFAKKLFRGQYEMKMFDRESADAVLIALYGYKYFLYTSQS